MKIRFNRIFLLVFTVLLGPVAANAVPTLDPASGHHYEAISRPGGITWQAARDEIALLPPYAGVTGHLVTITSAAENLFLVDELGLATMPYWLGGFQPPGTGEPNVGWEWVTGEPWVYTNWAGGEPNDQFGEDALVSWTAGTWNDGPINHLYGNGGYIIEYDTQIVIDADDCADANGCELPGTTLVFPPSAVVEPTDTITVQTFEVDDDPARCGVSSLVVFGDGDPKPDLHIPSWLCGSPKILILALDTSEVEFPDGVILVENDSPLPGNDYSCDSPNIPVGSDLRHQDVVGWQTTAFGDMVEDRYHADDPDPEFDDLAVAIVTVNEGHMGEYSDGCSSTRGRVRGGSYIGIGLHIHPNGTAAEGDTDTTPDNTLLEFHRITRYKLALLQFSIIESKPVLGRKDFRYMKKQVKQAIKQMKKGNFNAARAHVRNVERRAERAVYGAGGFGTENGEHLSRTANIIFMLDQKSSLP